MILAGDWVSGGRNVQIELCNQEMLLANLEGPILGAGDNFVPIAKAGPHLFSTSLTRPLKQMIVSLANNHLLDYGEAGLAATFQALRDAGVQAVGAGDSIDAARYPLIFQAEFATIGVLACCDPQFGEAAEGSAGVAAWGPWIYTAIRQLKQETDHVIVSVHSAVEDAPWPSPEVQARYRSYIDAGATLIHGHHAHIPQGVEEYNGGLIAYGLGNFVVDPMRWQDTPNALWSLGLDVEFSPESYVWRLFSFVIDDSLDAVCVRPSDETEWMAHADYIQDCCRPLAEPRLLKGLWHESALRTYYAYAARFLDLPDGIKQTANDSLWNAVSCRLRETWQVWHQKPPTRENYLLWRVMLHCESHRDALSTALGILSGTIEDERTQETKQLADQMMPWSYGVVP